MVVFGLIKGSFVMFYWDNVEKVPLKLFFELTGCPSLFSGLMASNISSYASHVFAYTHFPVALSRWLRVISEFNVWGTRKELVKTVGGRENTRDFGNEKRSERCRFCKK